MFILKNTKKITVTFDNYKIAPLGQIELSKEQWNKVYLDKSIRKMIEMGYLVARYQPVGTEKTIAKKNKEA